jgi:hypothetical protein
MDLAQLENVLFGVPLHHRRPARSTPPAPPPPARPVRQETTMPQVVEVEALIERLSSRTTGSAAGRIPGLTRAAEHLVLEPGTNAATPHGTYPASTVLPPDYIAGLDAKVAARTGVLLGRLGLLVGGTIAGAPMLPVFESAPSAGPQNGQKRELYSRAFTVSPDPTPTLIDAGCYLNVSLQVGIATATIVDRLLRLAVVAEAERQVIAAIEAETTTPATDLAAAFATFTGMWSPSLLVVPPGDLVALGPSVPALNAAGITIAVVPTASTTTVLDPLAVTGMLADAEVSAVEPALLGRQVASLLWGKVSISPGGACSVA